MSAFDQSIFWPSFKVVGFLKLATVKQSGAPVKDVDVGYVEPDREGFVGRARSKDYEIEYQVADLPRLAEGDAVTIWADDTKASGVKFRVRESPFVPEIGAEGNDGYFKRALLTKI
jgi:hypothetical protein